MSAAGAWLFDLGTSPASRVVDGLQPVHAYQKAGRPPEEVAVMEKAASFGAYAVFFEASRNDRAPTAQAFVFVSDGPSDDPSFGEIHRRLWSWGGVPLVYRKTPGLIQLFRCAHKADFVSPTGETICKPYKTLKAVAAVSSDPWWDSSRLRNGTLWDDPQTCHLMLSSTKAAHNRLVDAVDRLNRDLNTEGILKKHLRRKLLILSLLIAYLEERGVFPEDFFSQFRPKARKFFEVLADGKALVKLLAQLEDRFNGHVFILDDEDADSLIGNGQLARFARLIESKQEENGQLTLWQLYSFKDLPVELISHIYQLFVTDVDTSVYTPPFLVRLMLDEAMNWERLDRLHEANEVIVDPSCGSGIFLVEAYKRLVLHWRSRNEWKRPGKAVLKSLLGRVHGIDLEEGAIELAAFSLCLALCDALEPEAIRTSIKLFPRLAGKTLHHSCFFEAKAKKLIGEPIGVIVGNPPFKSSLTTPGAVDSGKAYELSNGQLPDKQLAYLFLHEAMSMVAPGGVLSMLQQYNFLYNQQSSQFRRNFLSRWDVREVLDLVSIRGLFHKGGADTKVVVIVAEAQPPKPDRKILHATFRRTGRVDAELGFDIDYYDLHWVPCELARKSDRVWRANLFGGGRALAIADRLTSLRTLGSYAAEQKWDYGEGFIEGSKGNLAEHIGGKPYLDSEGVTVKGVDVGRITKAPNVRYERPRTASRFRAPMILIREHMDLPHVLWPTGYLTYSKQLVGFPAPSTDLHKLTNISNWLTEMRTELAAYVALISPRLFTQKATALQADDIYLIPYPEVRTLDLSENEKVILEDIVRYQREFVRVGEKSLAMMEDGFAACADFSQAFVSQINAVYKKPSLTSLKPYRWPGVVCQVFSFGDAKIDWAGVDELRDKLSSVLVERCNSTLHVTRMGRFYDGNFIFLLKPDRLRYWLRSVALRDADETLADLRAQGL
jgi:hypothetical protein